MQQKSGLAAAAIPSEAVQVREVDRDIFPLPRVLNSRPPLGLFSRKSQQRIGRRRHFEQEVDHTVDALNTMYGRPGGPHKRYGGSNSGPISSGQAHALEFVEDACRRVGAPPLLSGPEALEELRVAEGYDDLPTSCPLGSFNPDLVSLPSEGMNPVPLECLWGEGGQQEVEDFTVHQTLCIAEARERLDQCGLSKCYEDPQFRDRRKYASFLHRLLDLGLITLGLEPAVETVGIFFVKKKGGKLRMILDCRRSNCHFSTPENIKLATGESMSRMELKSHGQLFTASADLQNAFYTMAMPSTLQKFFGLRKVQAGELGVAEVAGLRLQPTSWIYPRIAVIPMGWSHAMWWCQRISERICERSGLLPSERLRDGQPPPQGTFFHVQYVDNLHIFGNDKEEVETRFWKAVEALRAAGLTVHEIEVADGSSKVLGWEIEDGGYLAPSLSRLWRCRLGIRELLRRGRASGQQLERLIGHMTFVSLCRRESLSVLGDCYTFIQRNYTHSANLWKSVRRELWQWDGIAPLIRVNMKLVWGDTIYAVDASDWGLGVVSSTVEPSFSQQLGRYVERWRFKDDGCNNPRSFVQVEGELEGVHHAQDEGSNPSLRFKGVPFTAVDRTWQVVGRKRWQREETMPVYEARATQYAVRHILRSQKNFGKKFIVLTDSMTAAVSFDKGRAQSFRLRRVVQQTAALCLGSGTLFRCRWVPSEWNPADGPSRSKFAPSKPVHRFWDDSQTTGHSGDMEQTLGTKTKDIQSATETHQESQAARGRPGRVRGFGGDQSPSCPPHLGHRTQQHARSRKEETKSQETTAEDSRTRYGGAPQFIGGEVHPQEVQRDVAELCPVECRPSATDHDMDPTGQTPEQLPRGALPRGRRPEPSKLCDCCRDFPCAGNQRPGSPSEGPTGHEGVAEALPTSKPDAHPLRGHLSGGQQGDGLGSARDCIGFDDDISLVFEAWRGLLPQSPRFGLAVETKRQGLQRPCHSAPSAGGGGTIQDKTVGRDVDTRSAPPEVFGSRIGALDAGTTQEQGRAFVPDHSSRDKPVPRGPVETSGVATFGSSAHVPSPPRRSIVRGSKPVERDLRHSNSGSLVDTEVHEELRERGAPATAVWKPQQAHSKRGASGRQRRRQAAVEKALSPKSSLKVAVFIEIFCGCGRLGRSVAHVTAWPVLLWDIAFGPDYDLTKRKHQQLILGWLQAGLIRGGHLGTPCNSFSRARDRPGGPPRLRSDELPLGLPNLRPVDSEKIRVGNCLMFFSCAVLRLALHWQLPFTMENPSRSRIWLCPSVRWLLKRRNVSSETVHYCAFGTRWKKPTSFLGTFLDLSVLSHYKCHSSRRGICQYSHKPHLPLMGQNEQGVWYTKLAEPYPNQLTKVVAVAFNNSELSQLAMAFQRHC